MGRKGSGVFLTLRTTPTNSILIFRASPATDVTLTYPVWTGEGLSFLAAAVIEHNEVAD